jgi:hypothetical protein
MRLGIDDTSIEPRLRWDNVILIAFHSSPPPSFVTTPELRLGQLPLDPGLKQAITAPSSVENATECPKWVRNDPTRTGRSDRGALNGREVPQAVVSAVGRDRHHSPDTSRYSGAASRSGIGHRRNTEG